MRYVKSSVRTLRKSPHLFRLIQSSIDFVISLLAFKVVARPFPILRACARYVGPLTDNGLYLRQGALASDLIRLVDWTSQPIQCRVEELLDPGCRQTNLVQR